MELTIRKEDLVKGLGKSQPIVEKKTSMPILSNVLIQAKEDMIVFRATDLETSFEGKYPAKVSKEGSITVPANKLFEIVKELPSEDIYLKTKENSYLHVTGGRAKFELVGLPAEDFPAVPRWMRSLNCKFRVRYWTRCWKRPGLPYRRRIPASTWLAFL